MSRMNIHELEADTGYGAVFRAGSVLAVRRRGGAPPLMMPVQPRRVLFSIVDDPPVPPVPTHPLPPKLQFSLQLLAEDNQEVAAPEMRRYLVV